MAMPSFIFDASKGETPETLAKKRAVAEALMGRASRAPRDIGEGLQAVGNAILYRSMAGKADAAEAAGRAGIAERFNSALSGTGGGFGAVPGAAGFGGGAVDTPSAPYSGPAAPDTFSSLYQAADEAIGMPGFTSRVAGIESSHNPNGRARLRHCARLQ